MTTWNTVFFSLVLLAGSTALTAHVGAQQTDGNTADTGTPTPSAPTADSDTDNSATAGELAEATAELATEKVELRYRLTPQQELRYRVEHLATVDTTIEGTQQKTQSRSVSTKVWHIHDSIGDEKFSFSHSIEDVQMWQEVSGRKPVEYNSRTDKQPPAEYEAVAAQLGKPLADITIDPTGKIIDRKDHVPQTDLGFGAITIQLPAGLVGVGTTWASDAEIRARTESGQYKKVTIRQKFRLEKIQTGIATISMRSEVITPVNDARVRSQIVQRLSQGTIKFDIDAGHVVSKELEWNESVLAFNGADSNMKYLARFTETLITEPQTAQRPTAASSNSQ